MFPTRAIVTGCLLLCVYYHRAPADEQHNELRWWSPQALLEADDAHPNTKAYF